MLLDPEGRQLDGSEAIARAALIEARAILSEDALGGRIDLAYRIDVEDRDDNLVHRLHFADAMEIVGGRDGS